MFQAVQHRFIAFLFGRPGDDRKPPVAAGETPRSVGDRAAKVDRNDEAQQQRG